MYRYVGIVGLLFVAVQLATSTTAPKLSKCIIPKPTPKQCKTDPNAIQLPCGDPCPKNCENWNGYYEVICALSGCIYNGCKCKEGFVIGPNGLCIPPEQCPPLQCRDDPNSIVLPCGNPCPTTCENRFDGGIRPCPAICIHNGCTCKEGYVLGSKEKCIREDKCPPIQCKDDPNAIIDHCGDSCPTTCDNMNDEGIRPCPSICLINGCRCKKGYVLGPQGKCILPEKCPCQIKCGKNEEYDRCPPSCPESTCADFFNEFQPICRNSRPWECRPACRCKPGYLRKEGKCVRPCNCCTDPNSELVKNANTCPEGTCRQPEFTLCYMAFLPYGCQCKKGYVKISDTDPTCIPLKD